MHWYILVWPFVCAMFTFSYALCQMWLFVIGILALHSMVINNCWEYELFTNYWFFAALPTPQESGTHSQSSWDTEPPKSWLAAGHSSWSMCPVILTQTLWSKQAKLFPKDLGLVCLPRSPFSCRTATCSLFELPFKAVWGLCISFTDVVVG